MLWVRIPFMRGVLNTTLCDKDCQWLVTGRWFSPGTLVSFTNKTGRHDITEILLKVALNTITLTLTPQCRPNMPDGDPHAWCVVTEKLVVHMSLYHSSGGTDLLNHSIWYLCKILISYDFNLIDTGSLISTT